jgi:bifunctional non-homologous end joining protein LigD
MVADRTEYVDETRDSAGLAGIFPGGFYRTDRLATMTGPFVVHRHKTGRPHFDLRLVHGGILRSWSLLRELPKKDGDKRLAIERESFEVRAVDCRRFEEEAFGEGNVYVWDKGEAQILEASAVRLMLELRGTRLSGRYQLNRMHWYPGNRWLLQKLSSLPASSAGGGPAGADPG